ncbi:unnamed protein product [Clonostachys rosea]|uniref:Gfd2/YDR514C-like C-terminal domain-containing protein n=1 Tax=Bionectria ochroleuca TaxID=29856 RepID=A0ABY6UXS7_BIOOC|nr:unnamed protein product [Clonostachys rosea]
MDHSTMHSSTEGTSTKSLYADLLATSLPEVGYPPNKVDSLLDPSLGAIGQERLDLGHIRRLFGYYEEDAMSKINLGKSLPNCDMKDVLFLSVYICQSTVPDGDYFDIGLSVLDIRYIRRGMKDCRQDIEWPMQAVQSYHFRVKMAEWVPPSDDGKFCFGRSANIIPKKLHATIDDLVRGRDFVIVVSNHNSYVHNFEDFGIDSCFSPLCSINIVSAYNHAMQTSHTHLEGLMSEMNQFYVNIHHPGNAAHYNLRALMGLVTHDAANNKWPKSSGLIRYMAYLATSPVAMYTIGYEQAWVDCFFLAHVRAVGNRRFEAMVKHGKQRAMTYMCVPWAWLKARGKRFGGH